MSLMVSRSNPSFELVRRSKERRCMSIRCGTSSGFSRREKVLRVTGAACDVANWATPQQVVGRESARVDSGQQGSTARDPAKYHRDARLGKPSRPVWRSRRQTAHLATFAPYRCSKKRRTTHLL